MRGNSVVLMLFETVDENRIWHLRNKKQECLTTLTQRCGYVPWSNAKVNVSCLFSPHKLFESGGVTTPILNLYARLMRALNSPATLTLKKGPRNRWILCCTGLKFCRDALKMTKMSGPYQESSHKTSGPEPGHYIDYVILAPLFCESNFHFLDII
jgi:hypothetical protein